VRARLTSNHEDEPILKVSVRCYISLELSSAELFKETIEQRHPSQRSGSPSDDTAATNAQDKLHVREVTELFVAEERPPRLYPPCERCNTHTSLNHPFTHRILTT